MAAEDNVVYGFDKPDSEALIGMLGSRAASKNPQDIYDATALKVGFTSAGATARSGATLGKGLFKLYWPAVSGSDRILTASSDTADVTVYNMSSSAVSASKYLMCLRWGDIWVCNWEDCA
jgi:hypothetical protein